jgi:hypothetical protein
MNLKQLIEEHGDMLELWGDASLHVEDGDVYRDPLWAQEADKAGACVSAAPDNIRFVCRAIGKPPFRRPETKVAAIVWNEKYPEVLAKQVLVANANNITKYGADANFVTMWESDGNGEGRPSAGLFR